MPLASMTLKTARYFRVNKKPTLNAAKETLFEIGDVEPVGRARFGLRASMSASVCGRTGAADADLRKALGAVRNNAQRDCARHWANDALGFVSEQRRERSASTTDS